MWKYVLKRVGLALITTFIILSLSFLLIHLLPFSKPLGKDEAQLGYYLNQVNLGFVIDVPNEDPSLGELLKKIESNVAGKHYFYETPVITQYFNWLKNIVTEWNWGYSTYINPNNSAIAIIVSRLPTTIKINIWSVVFSVPLGIILGIIAALKKNSMTDHTISTLIMVFISIPSFILITVFMSLFCYTFKLLPSQWPSALTSTTEERILGYILPVLCLSFGSICGYARFTRAELCEVMESDYILLARTKGLTRRQAILRHALRNAMVPIVPAILAEVIGLLSGSMILERLYGIPGTGDIYIVAINQKDYNVLFVDMALYTVIGLLSGVILDISYGFIDPRIRMGAKK